MNDRAGRADPYLERLKEARDSTAVLKVRLATLRSVQADIAIFVFEGDDDKVVYHQWVKRVTPELTYEPFVCGGKREVRKLKAVLARDLNNLADNIYFFVDRDFDDLSGFVDDLNTFMTDRYAVENYLVEEVVIDQCLTVEFPCHGKPDLRQTIIAQFSQAYDLFLAATKEVNRRVYFARRLSIEILDRLPSKIGKLADVGLNRVDPATHAPQVLIPLQREVSDVEQQRLDVEFARLNPRERYRGKFAMLFLERWLQLLAAECNSGRPGLFDADVAGKSKVRANELTMGTFASRSPLPEGFRDFVKGVEATSVRQAA